MYLFHNDYSHMCHPKILDRMTELQSIQMSGYGVDDFCVSAANRIRELCSNPELSVHFLVGGTQANLTVISAALRPHQAVLASEFAHINVHETGAVEATGHKIITLPSMDGKITAEQVEAYAIRQSIDENAEHAVQAKLVYISNATELGTIYNYSELSELYETCKKYGLYLFIDGARLGYALTAYDNDMTLADISSLCDVFYIGGTKNGALFGEAVVICNPELSSDFRYIIKQHGGMLAKGWLLGIQFDVLLKDGLYFDIAAHANKMADRIRETLCELGYPQFISGTTNQVFVTLPNSLLNELSDKFTFLKHEEVDEHNTAVRFCTSWASTNESINALCNALRSAATGKEEY